MANARNKTKKTETSPYAFVGTILPLEKRHDCALLIQIMGRLTGLEPKMWGPSIIGFGEYHYKYDSGREGNFFRIGFTPRAKNISIYIMPGFQDFGDELSRLGKHKIGKSCLYINRLSDIDEKVLEEIFAKSLLLMEEKYPT